MPARVAAITAGNVRLPLLTAPTMWPLVTPLQLQTCISFGISPTLMPRPRDWPERYEVTGHWSTPIDPAVKVL